MRFTDLLSPFVGAAGLTAFYLCLQPTGALPKDPNYAEFRLQRRQFNGPPNQWNFEAWEPPSYIHGTRADISPFATGALTHIGELAAMFVTTLRLNSQNEVRIYEPVPDTADVPVDTFLQFWYAHSADWAPPAETLPSGNTISSDILRRIANNAISGVYTYATQTGQQAIIAWATVSWNRYKSYSQTTGRTIKGTLDKVEDLYKLDPAKTSDLGPWPVNNQP